MAKLNLPQFDTGTMRTFFTRGFGLSVYKQGGFTWIRATINLPEGRIIEYLRSVNVKAGIFKLLRREVDAEVSTLQVLQRHNAYELGQNVRMKVK